MTGQILNFPTTTVPDEELEGPRSCDLCVHFMSGVSGEYCRALQEDIFNINEAEDCDIYEAV